MAPPHTDSLGTGKDTRMLGGHIKAMVSHRRHQCMVLHQEKFYRQSQTSWDLQRVVLHTARLLFTVMGVLDQANWTVPILERNGRVG